MTQTEALKQKLEAAGWRPTAETEDGYTICRADEDEAEYYFGMRLRGFSPACQPRDGFLRREDDPSGRYYDLIVYNRELTEAEIRAYDLDYLKLKAE